MHAVDYSLKLLSIGDYTEAVLRQKLRTKGFSAEEIASAIDFLKESRIVDDRRYAENYIALKSSVYGVYRMRQYLAKKGIHKEILDELLDTADKTSEYDAARAFLKKKLALATADQVDRNKLLGALARKGFSYSVATEALNAELLEYLDSGGLDEVECQSQEEW